MADTLTTQVPPFILHPPSSPLFLAGPTAVGKSDVALLLAERLGGEIISVDSMQVYRGLEIGTAKPNAAERARVPHHLIDVAELNELFDAAKFCALAKVAVSEIQARGHVPIFCGGTGLYFKAYLEGLGEAPPADAKLRAELEAAPLEELLRELAERDPATFEKIDRQNPRRVIRAVEVIRLTGKPFSAQRSEWKDSSRITPHASRLFVLSRPKPDLDARINARVEAMFAQGLVAETKALLTHGLEQNPTAMQAIGYRQVVEHLRGERSLPETIELVKIKTRQFAKRQMTWFRRHAHAQWVEVGAGEDLHRVAGRLLGGFSP
ncbi:MAG: transferase [Verrucomicrobiota bacterium]|jgi:tRNA dimethylallyltransferase